MKIRGENLVKRYGRREVVRGVSIEVSQGQVVGLLGPNGAGKTTTFYMVIGIVRPSAGRVWLGDEEVTRAPMYQRARQGISYLPQENSVFRRLTVRDNLHLVLERKRLSRRATAERVDELASQLHIGDYLDQRADVLSGGERRRVEIARALAVEPKFVLLDEPFTGIDPVTIDGLEVIIRNLTKDGIGVLITDHNVEATLGITDWNYILLDGQIFAEGTEDEIRENEDVRKFYLGEGARRGAASPAE
ncbi:MAG: LPS export ABC transporter ATP-binding protein [Fimbriimonadaceae bacterium]